jgi:hypothetical protein
MHRQRLDAGAAALEVKSLGNLLGERRCGSAARAAAEDLHRRAGKPLRSRHRLQEPASDRDVNS